MKKSSTFYFIPLIQQFLVLFIFLIAYCVQPLLVDVVKFNGGAQSSTFLFLIPHYYSMMLVGFMPTEKKLKDCNWRKGMIVSALDLINQILKKAGLVFAGAGVYIIIDSSSMIWTAIWSRVLLQRRLNFLQWIAIVFISVGVGLKALQVGMSFESEEFTGVVLIFIASILMGMTFVLNEMFMTKQNHSHDFIEGPNLVCIMGICCSVVVTLWQIGWTIPQFDSLVLSNIKKNNGDTFTIIISFLCLLLSGLIQSSTLWYLMKHLGAVTTGILKGLKVACVFLLSHIIFCEKHPSQCLNLYTATSAIICVLGVVMYSVVTANLMNLHSSAAKLDRKESKTFKQEASMEEREILVLQASMVLIAKEEDNSSE